MFEYTPFSKYLLIPVALNVWQQVEWGALPGQADHHRLGSRAYRVCVARADEAPWIRAICGPRRRFGRGCLHCDGRAGGSGIAGHSHQLPRHHSSRYCEGLQCGDPPPSSLSPDERRAYEQLTILFTKRRAYAQMMGTRPQTLYGLADSPVGLAAWLFDHGDGYGQPAAPITSAELGRTVNGHPAGDLTRDDVLDDFALYWLTNTAVSAALLLGKSHQPLQRRRCLHPGCGERLPGENYQAPRSWTERAYQNSSTTTRLAREGTMRPGNSRNSFHKRFGPASDH